MTIKRVLLAFIIAFCQLPSHRLAKVMSISSFRVFFFKNFQNPVCVHRRFYIDLETFTMSYRKSETTSMWWLDELDTKKWSQNLCQTPGTSCNSTHKRFFESFSNEKYFSNAMVHAGHYQFTIFQVHSSHQDVYIATGQNINDIALHSHDLRPSTCHHRIWWVLMIGV